MNASYFAEKFAAVPFPTTATSRPARMNNSAVGRQVYDAAAITEPQRNLLGGFVRQMNLLIISDIWRGDASSNALLSRASPTLTPKKLSSGSWTAINIAI